MSKSLHLQLRHDGVAVIRIDVPGSPVNAMNEHLPDELAELLDRIEGDTDVAAVVFASGKPDNFSVGADLAMLKGHEIAATLQALSRRAQQVMNQVAELDRPTAAVIHGTCLGAGLELALACDVRVASDSPATRLGLPEVRVGLLPGSGGTQRLPRLIGLEAALELMLTGKDLSARQAADRGLVDEVVPAAIALEVACARARSGEAGQREPALAERLGRIARDNRIGRRIIFTRARERVHARTRGNYPAPERILDAVKIGFERDFDAGLAAEASAFGELAIGDVSRELVRLFYLRRDLARHAWVTESVEPRPIDRVGVVGAGLMGADIAFLTAADAKLPVRLSDLSTTPLAAALRRCRRNMDRRVARGKATDFERARVMHRVGPTTSMRGFHACDLVIEAVPEERALKRRIIGQAEALGPEHQIIATNTSSIPIAELAEASSRPEAVIGMHYFSPGIRVPLVEIAVTEQTAPEVIATCVELARRQGKIVIVVNDGPGFYTTRILAAYMNEAMRLLETGAPIDAIDGALVSFGFPIGPLALADSVGLDVASEIGKVLEQHFGARMRAPWAAAAMVHSERLGAKSGRGFYRHDGRADDAVYELLGVQPRRKAFDADTIAWRCVLRMIDEAVRCLDEGIIRSPRDGDAGAVFGLGFPPFRGGPFRMIATVGAGEILDRMEAHQLAACQLLVDRSREAAAFDRAP